jgi:hypothetical protein
MSDERDNSGSDRAEIENIPWYEDNWEINPETGKAEWVPLFIRGLLPPGAPGPRRYLEIPGQFKDGKMLIDGEWVDPPPGLSPDFRKLMHEKLSEESQ